MLKIATHNSVTGEAGYGLLSWLVTPFARCQRLTLNEQLEAGVRYFDLRVRLNDGVYRCAHGVWMSRMCLEDALAVIGRTKVFVNVTYEGRAPEGFVDDVKRIVGHYMDVTLCLINEKRPVWRTLHVCDVVRSRDFFMHLDWHSWHTLIPIPWLWKRVYYDKPVFDDECFTFVDFL
jgi:hypothetical protein